MIQERFQLRFRILMLNKRNLHRSPDCRLSMIEYVGRKACQKIDQNIVFEALLLAFLLLRLHNTNHKIPKYKNVILLDSLILSCILPNLYALLACLSILNLFQHFFF